MSLYKDQLEAWLKTIDVKADYVLDIGGSANPVEKRTKSWEVEHYLIADNGSEEEYHDKWREPDFGLDLNKPKSIREYLQKVEGDLFDVVFCLEVFEYVRYPWHAMRNIRGKLKEGGTLYASFPAIYPVHQPVAVDSLRYTKAGIEQIMKDNVFEIKSIVPRKATKGRAALAEFYSLEGMRAAKVPEIMDIGYMVEAVKLNKRPDEGNEKG